VLVLYTGGTIGMKSENGAYVPVANYLGDAIRHTKVLHDNQCLRSLMTEDDWEIATDTSLGAVDLPFALPTSVGNRTLLYVIYEYEPLLDSSDMTMDDHLRIAADIGLEYDFFDGFVILHGTDTMCYTASALSFLLENLGKPRWPRQLQRLLGALILAGFYCVPEVCVFFHNELLRGNRCTKISTNDFDAFASPNCNPLAKLGIDVHVYWHRVLGADHTRKFRVHDTLCNQ
uniref:Asparaginase n=1 Tax=Macrostomum lignano TaxID=282301 RepID=A0A1I8JKI4_9PLAT